MHQQSMIDLDILNLYPPSSVILDSRSSHLICRCSFIMSIICLYLSKSTISLPFIPFLHILSPIQLESVFHAYSLPIEINVKGLNKTKYQLLIHCSKSSTSSSVQRHYSKSNTKRPQWLISSQILPHMKIISIRPL